MLVPIRTWFTAIVVVAIGACSGGERGETSTEPSTTGPTTSEVGPASNAPLLAYQTLRGRGETINLIRADGTDDHQIDTGVPGQALLPDWSHDGRRIVFVNRGGETEPLFVYDLAEGTSTQLFSCSDPCLGDDEPAFSADDRFVAFVRALGPFVDGAPSDCGLWIGEAATGEVRQVTSMPGCNPRVTEPRWSPDGTQLTYWTEQLDDAGRITGTAVFVIGADGQGNQQLTPWEDLAGEPDWSPDGTWIVFDTRPLRNYDSGVSDLFRIHPDGSGREQLTHYGDGATRATQPRYSPDGSQLVFTLVTRSRVLALMPADGGDVTTVTESGLYTHGTMQPAT